MSEQMKTETLDEMIAPIAEQCSLRMEESHATRTKIISAALRSLAEKLLSREPSEGMLAAAKPAFEQIDSWCAEMQISRGRVANWSPDDPPLQKAYRAMRAVEREELGMKPCQ